MTRYNNDQTKTSTNDSNTFAGDDFDRSGFDRAWLDEMIYFAGDERNDRFCEYLEANNQCATEQKVQMDCGAGKGAPNE